MELLTEDIVRRYQTDDSIAAMMDACSQESDEELTCQKWLRDSAPKRLIFSRLYGDLLVNVEGLRVLDVGGGLTSFTRTLVSRHSYDLIDLMAHDGLSAGKYARAMAERPFIHAVDWYDFPPHGVYDIVIANDLFPNVDQRLTLFLEKFLPISREIRLSLTFYPRAHFYMTRRVNGEEILCMLAWDGETIAHALEPFANRIVAPDFTLFSKENISVYPNGRQVCMVWLHGIHQQN